MVFCYISMNIFEPSTLLAVFPYVFISSFPIFGIILVTYWLVKDKRSKIRKNWFSNNCRVWSSFLITIPLIGIIIEFLSYSALTWVVEFNILLHYDGSLTINNPASNRDIIVVHHRESLFKSVNQNVVKWNTWIQRSSRRILSKHFF